MGNRVRTGVIGVGYLGQYHAEKYARHPDVDFVGIVDVDPARAAKIAAKLDTRAYGKAEDLFGKVDALSIVVPTVHHFQVARQCLQEGIHLLIEKPITETLAQADELIDLASRKGVVLQVGHIERFNPAVRAIKAELRTPKYIQTERRAPFTVRCTDVNVVLDLMIHDLDIVCDLAGSAPRELSAAGASLITREVDQATVRIVFANNAVADLTASRVSDEKKRVLSVFDGESLFSADYQEQKASRARKGDGTVPELVWELLPGDRTDTLNDEIHAFVNCIRRKERPQVSGAEGRRALALAQLITRNIESVIAGFVPIA